MSEADVLLALSSVLAPSIIHAPATVSALLIRLVYDFHSLFKILDVHSSRTELASFPPTGLFLFQATRKCQPTPTT